MSAAIDPKINALQYMKEKKIPEIMQLLTSKLLISKPEDPITFLVEELQNIRDMKKRGAPIVAFNESDLRAMFDAFDVTSQGYVSRDQYLKGKHVGLWNSS